MSELTNEEILAISAAINEYRSRVPRNRYDRHNFIFTSSYLLSAQRKLLAQLEQQDAAIAGRKARA